LREVCFNSHFRSGGFFAFSGSERREIEDLRQNFFQHSMAAASHTNANAIARTQTIDRDGVIA